MGKGFKLLQINTDHYAACCWFYFAIAGHPSGDFLEATNDNDDNDDNEGDDDVDDDDGDDDYDVENDADMTHKMHFF